MSDPDLDLNVYFRIRGYKVLWLPPLHVVHRDDRGPISLAGPGGPAKHVNTAMRSARSGRDFLTRPLSQLSQYQSNIPCKLNSN